MSDIQIMNSEMLEILKNYFEICSLFNDKLEEIKADEVLNINLELLKASITDLSINIANFKSDLQYNKCEGTTNPEISNTKENKHANKHENKHANKHENKHANQLIDNYTELDKQNISALFFMYLMQIDKDSILNNPVHPVPSTYNSVSPASSYNTLLTNTVVVGNTLLTNAVVLGNTYDDIELD